MTKNGVSDKTIDKLIQDYQGKFDDLEDMLSIAISVENFCAMSKDNQTAELSNLLCSING